MTFWGHISRKRGPQKLTYKLVVAKRQFGGNCLRAPSYLRVWTRGGKNQWFFKLEIWFLVFYGFFMDFGFLGLSLESQK